MDEPILAYHMYIVLVNLITDGCKNIFYSVCFFFGNTNHMTHSPKSFEICQEWIRPTKITNQNKEFNIPVSWATSTK